MLQPTCSAFPYRQCNEPIGRDHSPYINQSYFLLQYHILRRPSDLCCLFADIWDDLRNICLCRIAHTPYKNLGPMGSHEQTFWPFMVHVYDIQVYHLAVISLIGCSLSCDGRWAQIGSWVHAQLFAAPPPTPPRTHRRRRRPHAPNCPFRDNH